MKEVVVKSSKGGTGKTSITASFAALGGNDIVVADCDVDAADMHLLLNPDFADAHDFYSGFLPEIDQDLCTQCGECAAVCRFSVILFQNGRYYIDNLGGKAAGIVRVSVQRKPLNSLNIVLIGTSFLLPHGKHWLNVMNVWDSPRARGNINSRRNVSERTCGNSGSRRSCVPNTKSLEIKTDYCRSI